MKTKFTKGPWYANPVYASYEYRKKNLIDDYAITVNGNSISAGHALARVTNKENASLIAAAPEMYQMLKSIADLDDTKTSALYKEIEKILKKARGE